MKWISSLTLALLFGVASSSAAATIVDFTGNTTGSLATGTATINFDGATSFSGSITNTSPFQASLTGFGFDLGSGNLSGYSGTSSNANFTFSDADLGAVPQFNSVELDFGYLTGPNFAGGDPLDGLLPGQSLTFTVTGALAGFSEAQIASALYARFQQVGPNGTQSDVATVGGGTSTVIPEPGTMLLLGTGLLAAARARRRREAATE